MTAKEMFKKLGYVQVEKDDEDIIYRCKIKIDDWEEEINEVIFWLDDKLLEVDNYIDTNLLQAINQQVLELGWDK